MILFVTNTRQFSYDSYVRCVSLVHNLYETYIHHNFNIILQGVLEVWESVRKGVTTSHIYISQHIT